MTGDGVPDVVAGTEAGAARAVAIDGRTGAVRPGSVFSNPGYTGLVEVAVGDVTGDGVADIAIGTNEGTARVRVYRGGDYASRLILPVVPGGAAPTGLPPCPGLRGEPCRDYQPF